MSCELCGSTENLQTHHKSYNPPETMILCVSCHRSQHGHGVGNGIGIAPKRGKATFQIEWTPARLPKELFNRVRQVIRRTPFWTSENEFVRDAVREKLGKIVPAKKEA